tara:strand:- start:175 stop:993 length:819 start_codon:yes stop_codon:yes gene_type:complete
MITKTDRFESISAFAAHIDSVQRAPVKHAEHSKNNGATPAWDMGAGFAGALTMGLNGGLWDEGAAQLQSVDVTGAVDTMADTIAPAIIYDVTGGAVDISAYMSDDPECFFRLDDEVQQAPIIKIGVCAVPCANIESHELMNQGRAIMALVDALELQGYSTELTALIPFKKREATYLVEVVVKAAGAPWDASSVAFALAHPAFSRRLGFKALEVQPNYSYITAEGYGRGDIDAPVEYDIYFDYLTSNSIVSTPDGALEYVKETARGQCPSLGL